MAHKQVHFRSEAREKILRGASALADAIRITLGPKSKSVLIEKKWGKPLVCNDGVTIAKEFDLEDPEENLGAQMIREAAEKTGEAVGDGTSTSTILAHAILAEGIRNVTAGASAVDIKRGLDRGLAVAVEAIKKISRPVSSRKEKEQVAAISAHNDAEIGETGRGRDGKSRPGRRNHRRGSKDHGDDIGSGRRNAVRPWLSLTLFRDQSGEDGSGAG